MRHLPANSLVWRASKEWKVETGSDGAKSVEEVEVVAKAERRRFRAEYKLRVLQEADRCRQPGEIGALLRREGLYWSNLITWRKQRQSGELAGLRGKRRGPERREKNPLVERLRELERENARLKRRAERAEGIVELQKKVSEILGIDLQKSESD
jgi:transposase